MNIGITMTALRIQREQGRKPAPPEPAPERKPKVEAPRKASGFILTNIRGKQRILEVA